MTVFDLQSPAMDSQTHRPTGSTSKNNPLDSQRSSSAENEPAEVDGRRTKGSRRVAKLTPEQLARKRAHDREAQRNSRKRTAEQITALNDALDGSRGDNQSLASKNDELERKIQLLERQMAEKEDASKTEQISRDWDKADVLSFVNEPRANSFVEATPSWGNPIEDRLWIGPAGLSSLSSIPDLSSPLNQHLLDSVTSHPGDDAYSYSALPPSSYATPETSYRTPEPLARPTSMPGPVPGQSSTSLQGSRFTSPASTGPDFITTCWQRQPSVYAWQISTKLSPPDNPTDQLMLSVLQSLRHSAITDNLAGEELIGPTLPSLNAVFGWPSDPGMHPLPTVMNDVMVVLMQVIDTIPHRVAGLFAPYRLYQWLISPTQETYNNLYDWQTPRPSQLIMSHPAWMDFPPWGKFRDRLIENQHLYANIEFQVAYLSSMRLRWPYDPRASLVFEDGKFVVSPLMIKHLRNVENMYFSKEFRIRYPEFTGLCNFEDD